MKSQLEAILNPYENCPLECDGFTRIASYLLNKNSIKFQAYCGIATINGEVVDPHFWIESHDFIVDYRLRMWLGETAPHGVFVKPDTCVYEGEPIQLNCPEFLFNILVKGF